jgi:trans-aconitate 2-methyltransferase
MTEWNAPGYAKIAGLQEAMAAEVLALLQLNGTERVLDLGCGNGKIAAEIATRIPDGSVIGVDASAEMIAFASEEFPAATHPNLRFEVADIRRLRFHEEFDLVVSFNALHWIPDQDTALRAIHSAMRTGAVAQLRLVSDGARKSLETVIEETRESPPWAGHFQDFRDPYLHVTPEQYAELAERNGFRVQRIQAADKTWDFKERSAFEASCMVTLIEWTRRLPENERLVFVRDVLDRYKLVAGGESTFKFYQMDVTLTRA